MLIFDEGKVGVKVLEVKFVEVLEKLIEVVKLEFVKVELVKIDIVKFEVVKLEVSKIEVGIKCVDNVLMFLCKFFGGFMLEVVKVV